MKYLNYQTIQLYQSFWKENEVNDLSGSQYSAEKNISFEILMLRSYLCDYSDAYTVLKRTAISMIEQTKS